MAYIDKYGVEFSDDKRTLIKCPEDFKGEYRIPNGVTSIGFGAFESCTGLTSISIPNTVKEIGFSAFRGCGITSIDIPDSVISIGSNAFTSCNSLQKVTFHTTKEHGMKDVGECMFFRCPNLESVNVLGERPTGWREEYFLYSEDGVLYCDVPAKWSSGGRFYRPTLVAFPQNKQLSSFTIPPGTREIARCALVGCKHLRTIRFDYWDINRDEISEFAIAGKDLEIIVPIGTKELFAKLKGMSAVKDQIKEEDFIISSDGKALCRYSPRLEGEYIIPDGIEEIRSEAFYGCKISSVYIPDSVVRIGEEAFSRCRNLTTIDIDEANPCYCSVDGVLYNKDKAILIQSPAGKTIQYIPQSVTKIASNALEYAEVFGQAREKIDNIKLEIQRKREQEQREKQLQEEKAREEAKRIAEEKERLRIIKEREEQEQKQLQEQQRQALLRNSILFFDTETTGLPIRYNAPINDSDNWPRLVQLAWLMVNEEGKILQEKSFIIYPDGFTIPKDNTLKHSITTEQAKREGHPLRDVLEEFMFDLHLAQSVVGHNIDFDKHIVGAELCRLDMDCDQLMDKPTTCTMQSSTDYCAIPNPNGYFGYKWPSLQELYFKLFNRNFDDAHDALADITATKECFFELRKRGII